MTPSVPARIELARRIRHLTAKELANRLGVSPGTISHYENGRIRVSAEMLRKLSEVLHFPEPFFTDREAVSNIDPRFCNYRGLARLTAQERHFIEGRGVLLHELLETIGLRLELPKTDVPSLPDATPSEAANQTRRAWGLGDGLIPNVVDLLEFHGIWVCLLRGEFTKAVDALSYWHDGRGVMLLNPAKQDAYRSRFDAVHELGHLVMHEEPRKELREKEAEANEFAACFLMPASTWRRDAPRSTNPTDYLHLKNKWKVSVGAMIRRSKDLGLLTDAQYQTAMVRYSALGFRRHEPGMEFVRHEEPRLMSLCLKSLQRMGVSIDSLAEQLNLYPDNLTEVLGDLQPGPDGESTTSPTSTRIVRFRGAADSTRRPSTRRGPQR